jgi:hypothetical protein
MRPARRADNSTILVVLNVKVRMGAQNSVPDVSLHDLLGKPLPLYFTLNCLTEGLKCSLTAPIRLQF